MRDYVRGFLREQYDVTAVEDGVAALAAASKTRHHHIGEHQIWGTL
jgi:hypothetical protein